MKKITLNGIKYEVPTSWDDVTIAHQIRVAKIAEEYSGMTAQLQLIAGYANIPVEVIKKTNISKLPTLVKHLQFVHTPIEATVMEKFTHKGEHYSVMPTLIDGEFQDFISLEAVLDGNRDNPFEGLPLMVAILAKKEGETLDDYDIEERAKEFYDLPITIANNVSSFFLNLGMVSQLNTPTSSNQVENLLNKEVIKRFEELESTIKLSGGQGLHGRFQRWTLRKFAKSLKKSWDSSLIGTQSKS